MEQTTPPVTPPSAAEIRFQRAATRALWISGIFGGAGIVVLCVGEGDLATLFNIVALTVGLFSLNNWDVANTKRKAVAALQSSALIRWTLSPEEYQGYVVDSRRSWTGAPEVVLGLNSALCGDALETFRDYRNPAPESVKILLDPKSDMQALEILFWKARSGYRHQLVLPVPERVSGELEALLPQLRARQEH